MTPTPSPNGEPRSDAVSEMRCGVCVSTGVECPKGYFSGVMKCDVCSYRFTLVKANCAPEITCPECEGSVDHDE